LAQAIANPLVSDLQPSLAQASPDPIAPAVALAGGVSRCLLVISLSVHQKVGNDPMYGKPGRGQDGTGFIRTD